jgi:hypothetical protein
MSFEKPYIELFVGALFIEVLCVESINKLQYPVAVIVPLTLIFEFTNTLDEKEALPKLLRVLLLI